MQKGQEKGEGPIMLFVTIYKDTNLKVHSKGRYFI